MTFQLFASHKEKAMSPFSLERLGTMAHPSSCRLIMGPQIHAKTPVPQIYTLKSSLSDTQQSYL